MPQIKEYHSQVGTAGPLEKPNQRASADEFGASIGRGVAQLGQAVSHVAEVQSRAEEAQEVADLHGRISDIKVKRYADLKDRYNSGEIDIDDFRNGINEDFSEVGGEVRTKTGKLYLQRSQAESMESFTIAAMGDRAKLAGEKARTSMQLSIDNHTAILNDDPSQLNTAIFSSDEMVESSVASGFLPSVRADEFKAEFRKRYAKSAIRGWIKNKPELAKQNLEGGTWDQYLDGDLKHQLEGESDREINRRRIEQERVQSLEREAKRLKDEVVKKDLVTGMIDGNVSTVQIRDAELDASTTEHLFFLQDRINKQKVEKSDPVLYNSMLERIHLPDGDPRKITDQDQINNLVTQLPLEQIKNLRTEFEGRSTIEGRHEGDLKSQFMKSARAALVKSSLFGLPDPAGEENLARLMVSYQVEYREAKKSGKSPMQLLDPDNKDGMYKLIQKFQKSPAQIGQEMSESMMRQMGPYTPSPSATPNPKARKPNETPQQWRERTKGM